MSVDPLDPRLLEFREKRRRLLDSLFEEEEALKRELMEGEDSEEYAEMNAEKERIRQEWQADNDAKVAWAESLRPRPEEPEPMTPEEEEYWQEREEEEKRQEKELWDRIDKMERMQLKRKRVAGKTDTLGSNPKRIVPNTRETVPVVSKKPAPTILKPRPVVIINDTKKPMVPVRRIIPNRIVRSPVVPAPVVIPPPVTKYGRTVQPPALYKTPLSDKEFKKMKSETIAYIRFGGVVPRYILDLPEWKKFKDEKSGWNQSPKSTELLKLTFADKIKDYKSKLIKKDMDVFRSAYSQNPSTQKEEQEENPEDNTAEEDSQEMDIGGSSGEEENREEEEDEEESSTSTTDWVSEIGIEDADEYPFTQEELNRISNLVSNDPDSYDSQADEQDFYRRFDVEQKHRIVIIRSKGRQNFLRWRKELKRRRAGELSARRQREEEQVTKQRKEEAVRQRENERLARQEQEEREQRMAEHEQKQEEFISVYRAISEEGNPPVIEIPKTLAKEWKEPESDLDDPVLGETFLDGTTFPFVEDPTKEEKLIYFYTQKELDDAMNAALTYFKITQEELYDLSDEDKLKAMHVADRYLLSLTIAYEDDYNIPFPRKEYTYHEKMVLLARLKLLTRSDLSQLDEEFFEGYRFNYLKHDYIEEGIKVFKETDPEVSSANSEKDIDILVKREMARLKKTHVRKLANPKFSKRMVELDRAPVIETSIGYTEAGNRLSVFYDRLTKMIHEQPNEHDIENLANVHKAIYTMYHHKFKKELRQSQFEWIKHPFLFETDDLDHVLGGDTTRMFRSAYYDSSSAELRNSVYKIDEEIVEHARGKYPDYSGRIDFYADRYLYLYVADYENMNELPFPKVSYSYEEMQVCKTLLISHFVALMTLIKNGRDEMDDDVIEAVKLFVTDCKFELS